MRFRMIPPEIQTILFKTMSENKLKSDPDSEIINCFSITTHLLRLRNTVDILLL